MQVLLRQLKVGALQLQRYNSAKVIGEDGLTLPLGIQSTYRSEAGVDN